MTNKFNKELIKDFLKSHLYLKDGSVLEGIVKTVERGNDVLRSDGKNGSIRDYVIKNCVLIAIPDSIFTSENSYIDFENFNLVGGIHRRHLEVGDRVIVHRYNNRVCCYANLTKNKTYGDLCLGG